MAGSLRPDSGSERSRAGARGDGGGDARRAALDVLCRVLIGGRSLTAALAEHCRPLADPRERALARELAAGTVRRLPALRQVLAGLVERPLGARKARLEAVLVLGLYQVLHTRIPAHAAVHETVPLAGRHRSARGLVNAVLRRAAAERDAWLAALRDSPEPEARYAHPRWLAERVRADWPDDWEAVLAANQERAPMTVRASRRSGGRAAYLERLRAAGLDAAPHPLAPDAVVLGGPVDVDALPGFAAGEASVQDAAAQLAAPLLDLAPGQRVLDACAAPGGKTVQMLDLEPGLGELVAVDADPERLVRVTENLARTGAGAAVRTVAADAAAPGGWWDGRRFDRILIDAPCSGSGVIRRHPDVKLHRRPADLEAFAERQAALLDAAWDMLAPSGRVVYAVCSVFRQEGARQAARFLERHGDAEPAGIEWGRAAGPGRQILPGDDGMDGFFHACLLKGGRS